MKEKLIWTVSFFFLALQIALAQEKTITGVVKDEKGEPLPGITVTIKGSTKGVATDFDGHYKIKANVGDVLQFLGIGLKTVSKQVSASTNKVNVVMHLEVEELEGVVVLGYGSEKKVGTLVGSVSTVSGGQVAERPTANVLDALQGKVPGLQIYTSSGEPSALSSIRLHGVGSLGASSTPLFIVDGAPVSSSAMRGLNPSDFESVSVLKDASATSIYGSRAANGVVYITTKRGAKGEKGQISINTQYGISNLANRIQFEGMMNAEELTNFWVATGFRTQAQVDDLRKRYPHDTRWDKVYYRQDIPTRQVDVSVAGGSDKTRYYVSGGYLNQEGVMYRSGFEKYTFRINLDSKVNDWMKVGMNSSLAYYDYQTNPFGSNSTNGGLSVLAAPIYSPVDENGKEYIRIPGWNRYHPNYLADKNPSNTTAFEVIPTGFVEIKPIKNLTYKLQGNIQFSNGYSSSNRLPSYIGNLENGTASRSYSRYLQKTLTNTLEYKFGFDQNNFVVLAGQEVVSSDFRSFNASGAKLINDNLILLSHAVEEKNIGEGRSFNTTNSVFGRVEYNFASKYFVDFLLRRDGSSRFGASNKYANFWAAGAMWDMKAENFLADVDAISALKVKLSAGTSGNSEIGNYDHLPLVSSGKYDAKTTYYISGAGNPDLKWEKQTKYTLGVTAEFFRKINLNVELYRRLTEDMLMDVPIPYTTGFSSVTKNVGKLQNQGIDIAFDVELFRNEEKGAHFTPYVSFNYNQDKVLELFQGRDYWIVPNTGVGYAVGKPVTFFYSMFKGINPDTGKAEWYEPGTNPMETTLDDSRVTSTFGDHLEQSTGVKRYAPFNGGFGFSAAYQGFTLQADFSFSQGKYLINNDRFFIENPTRFGGFNQNKAVTDYWKKPGDVTKFPKWGDNFTEFDSRLIEDASFVRLKNLTLAYSLPEEVLKQVGFFKRVRLYATGRNVLTWTKYTGLDPEVDSNLTLGVNPNTKQYVFGVELKF
ncbi:SusC/RagA family TonB-linked outer membrane protein [Capnocytophaga stomatis]|uniref:SusC/RagA family TonB-linked outer membrane protein n=1 Tax=Capnocytophaga stomatis TaxID=1848904 RepID=UPI00194E2085|nr:SusC/RagA family TonB-linked outer membrane protein [Capnocytophaga stomatis]GIJ97518.1 SusC/RagA family TonB-linked outer membrane protein [Capnocytophaga stomatis]